MVANLVGDLVANLVGGLYLEVRQNILATALLDICLDNHSGAVNACASGVDKKVVRAV